MPEGTRELRLVVTATDYESALHFYRDVLGLAEEAAFVDDNGGRAALLHAGRATVELGDEAHAQAIDLLEVGRRVAGPLRLAFEVDDAAAATTRLVDAGAELVAGPVHTPWRSLNARIAGPDAQQLTLYSQDIYLVERPRLDGPVLLSEHDPTWSVSAGEMIDALRAALGPTALVAEHVGSTAVPGLPAKPVLDLVLAVPEPGDEASYVPALEALGYELFLRQPEWHEHRLLKHSRPMVNLHVFPAGAAEVERMVLFRDHLRRDSSDRELYLRTKRELAGRTWAYVQDYADAKSDVVTQILVRAGAGAAAPVRGRFVLVTGSADGGRSEVASELAAALGLPLLAGGQAATALARRISDRGLEAAMASVVLALAAHLDGAVLDLPLELDQADVADVAALPGQVVEVSCGGDPAETSVAPAWPVVVPDAGGARDVARLAGSVLKAFDGP